MAKVALVSSAGGHLTEVLAIAQELAGEHELVLWVADYPAVRGMELSEVARTERIRLYGREQKKGPLLRLRQQLGVALEMAIWCVTFVRLMRRERPDAIISVGAEIAVPAFLVNRLFFRRRSIYVESLARLDTPSLTGRLVRRLVDRVFVQWPDVLRFYGANAEYAGRLI